MSTSCRTSQTLHAVGIAIQPAGTTVPLCETDTLITGVTRTMRKTPPLMPASHRKPSRRLSGTPCSAWGPVIVTGVVVAVTAGVLTLALGYGAPTTTADHVAIRSRATLVAPARPPTTTRPLTVPRFVERARARRSLPAPTSPARRRSDGARSSPSPTASDSRPRSASTAPRTTAARSAAPGQSADRWATAVVAAINSARAHEGLTALTTAPGLVTSADDHNLTMAASNTLSHQLPGEPDLGAREAAAGVSWSAAGENIGWTSEISQAGALGIEASMLGETAPNDGHRRNILSASFTAIGVDVHVDRAHGRLWITEDFARLR